MKPVDFVDIFFIDILNSYDSRYEISDYIIPLRFTFFV